MGEVNFEIHGDYVYREKNVMVGNCASLDIVMDKKTFIEAYNKWIKGDEDVEPELKAVSPNVPPKFANKTEVLAKGCDEWYQEVYECRYCGKHFMVDRDAKGHPYLNCCPCCGNYVRDIVRE